MFEKSFVNHPIRHKESRPQLEADSRNRPESTRNSQKSSTGSLLKSIDLPTETGSPLSIGYRIKSKMSGENKLEKLRLLAQQKLVENGEKERLKVLLRNRLMEAGFNDEIMSYCKKTIKTNGIEKVDLETLINEITPKAREIVPDEVKIELLSKIKEILTKEMYISEGISM